MTFPSARPSEKHNAGEAIQMESLLAVADPDACIGCGKCVAACRHQAIQFMPRVGADDFDRAADVSEITGRWSPSPPIAFR